MFLSVCFAYPKLSYFYLLGKHKELTKSKIAKPEFDRHNEISIQHNIFIITLDLLCDNCYHT